MPLFWPTWTFRLPGVESKTPDFGVQFGYAVALTETKALVSAPGVDAVYVFDLATGAQEGLLTPDVPLVGRRPPFLNEVVHRYTLLARNRSHFFFQVIGDTYG